MYEEPGIFYAFVQSIFTSKSFWGLNVCMPNFEGYFGILENTKDIQSKNLKKIPSNQTKTEKFI